MEKITSINLCMEFKDTIDYNEITNSGAKTIANGIRQMRNLLILDLSNKFFNIDGNFIGDVGAKELFNSIKDSFTLTTLNLGFLSIMSRLELYWR